MELFLKKERGRRVSATSYSSAFSKGADLGIGRARNRPLQSPPLPLTVASSSLVNELRLLSDDHSSNLERNRRACEVAKLLSLLDLLQSIASIKADYIAQDSDSDFEVFELFDLAATGKVVGRISLSCFFCEYYANTLGFLELACDLLILVFSIEPDV
ncbi:hypothetical protein NC651_026689 [Populus alba x Populus x berolinensis]|nr:hypothetical protein NC651_026689 [Populus alba x Populus x berolinensis]